MSGPKGYGYRVSSAEELRRREDEARTGRCRQLAAMLADLSGQLDKYGVSPAAAVSQQSPMTHDSLIKWERDLQSAIRDTQARLREESGKALVRRLNATSNAVDVSGVTLGGRRAPARSVSPLSAFDGELERVAADVGKVVDLVASIRDALIREDLSQMAERVLQTTSPPQAKGDLLSLKTKAVNALKAQEYKDMATQAVLEIAHITSDDAEAIRERASVVASAEEVAELKKAVATLVEDATKARDAEFVEAALEEVLRELGFSLGDGFELADLGRSVAIADHSDHPGYGVRVQLNPANGMIYTRVVAEHTASPEDDVRVEEETCGKVHSMAENLARHGVSAVLQVERQPGDVPIDRHAATSGGTRRKRTRSRAAEQTRPAR